MNEEFDIEELAPWFLIPITLIGVALRILLLGSKGIWLDESFSVWVSNHSVAEMLQWIVKIDQHPPLYYLLLHYWIKLGGDAPFNVRLLSALFGAGAIPIIYLTGKRLSGAVAGLAAAVLLAVSTYHIYYGQEARMYTLLTFNASVAIYALVRLLTDPRSARPIGSQFLDYLRAWRNPGSVQLETPPDAEKVFSYKDQTRLRWLPVQAIATDLAWVALIVFSAITLLSHNTAVLFVLATNLFVLGLILYKRIKKTGPAPALHAPSLVNWVVAQIGILLLWSPWLSAFIRQARGVDQAFWIPKPTWDAVVTTVRVFLNASGPGQVSMLTPLWILYALVLGFGLLHYRKRMSIFILLAALFAVPFLGELIVSLRRPIFSDRTLIWVTIPLFLVIASGIAQMKYPFVVLGVLGIFSTFNLFAVSDYHRFYQKEDWSNPAGYVANFVQEGDLILFNDTMVQIPFDYYFNTWASQYSLQVEKHGVPKDLLDCTTTLEPKMTESDIPGLVSLVSGRKRVWLVYSHDSYTDPKGLVPQTLGSVMELVEKRDYYGVQLHLYAAEGAAP